MAVHAVGLAEVQSKHLLELALSLSKLDVPSTMPSSITNANASADTRSSRKRTRGTVDKEYPNPPSGTKRLKKETKLDRLKAELKQVAGLLKNNLEKLQGDLVDEKIAKECAGRTYRALLYQCDDILTGMEPNRDALAFLKAPFVDNFEPEEVLLDRLGQGKLPSRRARLR